ncbi:hypothetical protein CDAR_248671 [Caerostris darwini]|uniref:Uncharacterized protein n=1 Tax=Caerostris darwini TaxID=1538125 RepID=A0AAV4MSJ1_9ARAC|nr:hypothetical protein CDAR_248671 [Caerostris darwini]
MNPDDMLQLFQRFKKNSSEFRIPGENDRELRKAINGKRNREGVTPISPTPRSERPSKNMKGEEILREGDPSPAVFSNYPVEVPESDNLMRHVGGVTNAAWMPGAAT